MDFDSAVEELRINNLREPEDRQHATAIISSYPMAIDFATPQIVNDKKLMAYALSINGQCLQFMPKKFKKSKELVTIAITEHPYAFEYADPSLKKNKQFAKFVVNREGGCFIMPPTFQTLSL